MIIRYTGGSPSMRIPSFGDRTVKRGETIEVPDKLGASLIQQVDVWRKVTPRKSIEPKPLDEASNKAQSSMEDE